MLATMPTATITDLDKRIGQAVENELKRRGEQKQPFAKKIGLDPGHFRKLLHGLARWNTSHLEAVVKGLNISMAEILGIQGGTPWSQDQPDQTIYYAAPLVSGRIAAGPGRIVEEDVESFVWIYGPELKGRRRHELVAVRIGKDEKSMIPTLYPGDIVLLDRDDPKTPSDFKSGKIYAVRTSPSTPECSIKRLYAEGGSIVLASDNRKYPPVIAWTSDLTKLIIGRVVWGWRNLQEA